MCEEPFPVLDEEEEKKVRLDFRINCKMKHEWFPVLQQNKCGEGEEGRLKHKDCLS